MLRCDESHTMSHTMWWYHIPSIPHMHDDTVITSLVSSTHCSTGCHVPKGWNLDHSLIKLAQVGSYHFVMITKKTASCHVHSTLFNKLLGLSKMSYGNSTARAALPSIDTIRGPLIVSCEIVSSKHQKTQPHVYMSYVELRSLQPRVCCPHGPSSTLGNNNLRAAH